MVVDIRKKHMIFHFYCIPLFQMCILSSENYFHIVQNLVWNVCIHTTSESEKEDPEIINLLGNLQNSLLSQNKLHYSFLATDGDSGYQLFPHIFQNDVGSKINKRKPFFYFFVEKYVIHFIGRFFTCNKEF